MKKIVITGGIASGKSTLASTIRKAGYQVIDADVIARQVVEPGKPGLEALVEAFGEKFLNDEGYLDRGRLRELISHNLDAQKKAGQILHPIIRSEIQKTIDHFEKKGEKVVFVEAALAIESGSYKSYDELILVTSPEKVRVERIMLRDGVSADSALAILQKQMPDSEKMKFATIVFSNESSIEAFRSQVRHWLEKQNW